MRFGLDVPVNGPYGDVRELAELAADAEASGWDGVFVQDTLSGALPAVDPWIALGAMALRTQRVRLGVFLTPLPRRRPWQVARQAVTIDHLSGGRLVFGAALGYDEVDFVPFGEEWHPRRRAERLDEALDVLTRLWTGEPVTYAGTHYQLAGALLAPASLQRPRIPVWTAAGWPRRRPLRRAASWDGAYLMTVHQETGELLTPADIESVAAAVRDLRGAGDAPFDIALNPPSAGDQRAAHDHAQAYAEAGATWWVELAEDGWTPADYRARICRGPPSG